MINHAVLTAARLALGTLTLWIGCRPSRRPDVRALLKFLLFPLLYVIYVLVRGAAIDWYPYPFLNPSVVGGYPIVAAYAAGMLITFVVAGALTRAAHRGRNFAAHDA